MRVGRIASLDLPLFIRAHWLSFRQALLGAIIALASVAAFALPAYAAAPRIIIVDGDALAQPVVLSDWNDNLTLLLGEPIFVGPGALDHRSSLGLALFWGPEWNAYVNQGRPIEALQPEQANQQGRLYLGIGDARALIALENPHSARIVKEDGLQILSRAGIPVDVDGLAGPGEPGPGSSTSHDEPASDEALASAPRIIMVHSEPAMPPAFLSDWNDNLTLVRSEPIEVTPEVLDQRPFVHLALFWGPEWNAYIDRGGRWRISVRNRPASTDGSIRWRGMLPH